MREITQRVKTWTDCLRNNGCPQCYTQTDPVTYHIKQQVCDESVIDRCNISRDAIHYYILSSVDEEDQMKGVTRTRPCNQNS